jgi:hypothetical protein
VTAAARVVRVQRAEHQVPVSAAWIAISAVARSRISPTMMMSGSWRISARRPFGEAESSAG